MKPHFKIYLPIASPFLFSICINSSMNNKHPDTISDDIWITFCFLIFTQTPWAQTPVVTRALTGVPKNPTLLDLCCQKNLFMPLSRSRIMKRKMKLCDATGTSESLYAFREYAVAAWSEEYSTQRIIRKVFAWELAERSKSSC